MTPNSEELEALRAEFAALPNVLGATIEFIPEKVIPAKVLVVASIRTLNYEDFEPIIQKELELYDRLPDLRLDIQVDFSQTAEEIN
jgi:hypothetical protein